MPLNRSKRKRHANFLPTAENISVRNNNDYQTRTVVTVLNDKTGTHISINSNGTITSNDVHQWGYLRHQSVHNQTVFNSNIPCIPEPNKNTIVLFDVCNYSSSTFRRPSSFCTSAPLSQQYVQTVSAQRSWCDCVKKTCSGLFDSDTRRSREIFL